MGRRNDHNTEEFNELVLTGIEDFLIRLPASELSLRKVAKMIGYAPSTLIHTYGNWSLLLLKVNARTLDRLLEELRQITETEQDPETRLFSTAHSYLQFACKQPHLWSLVFEHKLPLGADIPDWMQNRINQLFDLVKVCLQSMNPNVGDEESRLAANTLWASVHGITWLTLDDKLSLNTQNDPKVMLDNLISHYLRSWKQCEGED